MKLYHDMSKREAADALQVFLDERPAGLARLRQAMAEDGVDPDVVLDGSVESLVPLWRWATSRFEARPAELWRSEDEPFGGGLRLPSWHRHGQTFEPTLTYETVWLVDALTSYFCQVITDHVPQGEWRVGYHRIKAYNLQRHPVFGVGDEERGLGGYVAPAARRYLTGQSAPDDYLAVTARAIIDRLTAPPEEVEDERPPLFEVETAQDGGDFNLEVALDDELAHEHSRLVSRMVKDLAAQDGVREVHREDREILLVSAPEWTSERLERWLGEYLAAKVHR